MGPLALVTQLKAIRMGVGLHKIMALLVLSPYHEIVSLMPIAIGVKFMNGRLRMVGLNPLL